MSTAIDRKILEGHNIQISSSLNRISDVFIRFHRTPVSVLTIEDLEDGVPVRLTENAAQHLAYILQLCGIEPVPPE